MTTFAPNLSGTNALGGGAPMGAAPGRKKQLSQEQAAMREYCMGSGGTAKGETTVLLHVSHSNLKSTFFHELRLDLHMTILNVKHKLEFHTGTSAVSCQLYLMDESNQMMAECEDERKLGYYSPYDGCRLHIVDTDPNSASAGGWLEDTSLVKKYEISEEAYSQRENTYRRFKEKKLQEDPNWTFQKDLQERQSKAGMMTVGGSANKKVEDEEHLSDVAAGIKVGDRCEVAGGRRGEVMYVGKVPELPLGYWVGVKYDEPVGKNDGSVKGSRYFECLDNYGGFLRPDLVQVGDFPEEDPFAELDGEM